MPDRQRSIYFHLGIGLALAISAIVLVAGLAAQQQDKASLKTQRDVVKYETNHIFDALVSKLSPMIYWQEAFDKIVTKWDAKWVAYQFGPYLDSQNINGVLIFDQDGRLKHLYSHGLKQPLLASQLNHAAGLVELRALVADAPVSIPPVLKHGMIEVNGRPYFAVAGQIAPEDKKFLTHHINKHVAIFLTEASKASYATLVDSFHISNLTVGRKPPERSLSSVALTDADGKPITYLWWAPQKPGNDFLKLVIPLTLVVFFILAAMQAAIVKRWQSLQRALFSAEAKQHAAEDESRAKSVFLGTISHELRTPLNAILGFSDILGKAIFGPLGSPRYETYVNDIQKSGRDLLAIVDDLLEVARIGGQERNLVCSATNVSALIKYVVQEHRAAAREKDISLTIDVTEQLWADSNDTALAQIVGRVLSNAIKFSMPGCTVHVSALRHETGCEIVISDNGIGISDELLGRIFQPFAQGEDHLARKHGGMGLGLPITRALSKAMGADLHIQSKAGHGTLVTLLLPAAVKGAGLQGEQFAA